MTFRIGAVLGTLCIVASIASAADGKPPAPAGQNRAAPSARLAENLKQAFDQGFVSGSKHLHAAQKQIEQARQAAPRDPRVEYAAGLMLLKQTQPKPALARFEAALKLDKNYWPAWQGAIWVHLAEKQIETGLKQLDEFAPIVQEAEHPEEVSEAQRETARWMGQLFEAALATADSKKTREQVASHEEHLLEAFEDELSEAFGDGRETMRDRIFELEQESGLAQAAAGRSAERRKKDKSDKLSREIDDLGKAKQTAAKSAEEWKDWLDDVTAKADKQLGLLERDYKFLNQRAGSLMQSIILIGQQITALESYMNTQQYRNQAQGSVYGTNASWQLMQSQNQMFGYQLDYNATLGRMSGVAEQGALVAQQKADAIQRYENATGQLSKKEADLDKWSGRLKNQKQKLTVQKPPKGKKGAADKKQHLSIKTLFPFDLEHERDRLLETFAPAVANDANDPK